MHTQLESGPSRFAAIRRREAARLAALDAWIAWITLFAILAFFTLCLTGCGGSSPSGTSTALSTMPALPNSGNYKATFQSNGSLLVNAGTGGTLQISAVNPFLGGGAFTGTATVNQADNFTATLTGSSPNESVTVQGQTYSNNLRLTLSGWLTGTNIIATYIGTANPFTGRYSGTVQGGTVGLGQTISLNVLNGLASNVAGTMTTSAYGTLSIQGSMSEVGTFTGVAYFTEPSQPMTTKDQDHLDLAGAFTITPSGQLGGSGVWSEFFNTQNDGVWTVRLQ